MTADGSLGQLDLLVSAAGLSAAHTRMSEDEAERLVARYRGLSGHARGLTTEKDDTFAVRADGHRACILKVTNPAEDPREGDLEIQLMRHVARASSLVPVPQLFDALDGQLLIALEDAAGQLRQARLMSFIADTPLDSTSLSPAERGVVGRTLGVTIAGTGHQDIFWTQLICMLTGASHRIDSVHGRTSWNVDDYCRLLLEERNRKIFGPRPPRARSRMLVGVLNVVS